MCIFYSFVTRHNLSDVAVMSAYAACGHSIHFDQRGCQWDIVQVCRRSERFQFICDRLYLTHGDPIVCTFTHSHTYCVHYSIFTVGDELAFLTDFDGTLAEINPNPVLSRMNAKTTELIHRLARHPNIHLAVISGRRLSDVRERVGIANITYSGNHGMEITFSNQMEYHYPMPPEVYLNCSLLRNVLQQKLATHGAWVEDKNVSLTYHYRSVPAELQDEYVTLARQHTRDFGYKSVQAHYAIEIKPPVIWSKGMQRRNSKRTHDTAFVCVDSQMKWILFVVVF